MSILTERDFTRALAEGLAPDTPVAALASPHPLTIAAGSTVTDAATRMLRDGVRHLIVTRGNHAVGVPLTPPTASRSRGSMLPLGGPSVPAGAGLVDIAGLEEAQGALADVGELVGDDRVQTGFVEAELDEPALGRLEVEGLSATVRRVGS